MYKELTNSEKGLVVNYLARKEVDVDSFLKWFDELTREARVQCVPEIEIHNKSTTDVKNNDMIVDIESDVLDKFEILDGDDVLFFWMKEGYCEPKRTTFFEDTLQEIYASNHKPEDIKFIGSIDTGHQCDWNRFKALASDVYRLGNNHGYGDDHNNTFECASDLKIIFNDNHYMERLEINGVKIWDFSQTYCIPSELKPLDNIFSKNKLFATELEEINSK